MRECVIPDILLRFIQLAHQNDAIGMEMDNLPNWLMGKFSLRYFQAQGEDIFLKTSKFHLKLSRNITDKTRIYGAVAIHSGPPAFQINLPDEAEAIAFRGEIGFTEKAMAIPSAMIPESVILTIREKLKKSQTGKGPPLLVSELLSIDPIIGQIRIADMKRVESIAFPHVDVYRLKRPTSTFRSIAGLLSKISETT